MTDIAKYEFIDITPEVRAWADANNIPLVHVTFGNSTFLMFYRDSDLLAYKIKFGK